MTKKATTKKRPARRERDEERDQREYRAELQRATRHAAAVTRLTRELGRAIEPGTDAARRDAPEQIPADVRAE